MKLQQLRYLIAIADNGLNITAASEKLYTSQPGVSKQLKLLEEELGLRLFSRNGKSLDGITKAGSLVLEKARSIMQEVEEIKSLADDLQRDQRGSLTIGTTYTQATYVLPEIVEQFNQQYPEITVKVLQGNNEQIAEMVRQGLVDITIASHEQAKTTDTIALPSYHWDQAIYLPVDHPLAEVDDIDLTQLSEFPLITYEANKNVASHFQRAFAAEDLTANISITTRNVDVIKENVAKGMGVGIAASMAFDPSTDNELVAISAYDVLPSCTTWLGLTSTTQLHNYLYDFINLFSPHYNQEQVDLSIKQFKRSGEFHNIDHAQLPYRLIARDNENEYDALAEVA
ncbi:MAG: LysR substrate-binding domain-containing protein [Kangiellaceae bacterium]|jgi:LysR family cys regulon transcriptional activator|nr:LysR substrate-binding domain-containing protein [Kangiellaceae bacterium]